MKYYTKEWYQLMQDTHYVSGMTVLPDKEYTDEEIKSFYDADLAEELEHDRRFHEERGTEFHPEETVRCFEDFYQGVKTYALNRYPEWARKTLDPRLIALNRISQTPYNRLKELEDNSKSAFDKINADAREVLNNQNIPGEIKAAFRFHDADVLALKEEGNDCTLILSYDEPQYTAVIFRNAGYVDLEEDTLISECKYLYDELYRTEEGYEVHILLWSAQGLKYLTVGCGDIRIEEYSALDF